MDRCPKSVVFAIIFATSVYSLGYLPPKNTNIPCKDDVDCVKVPFTLCAGNTAYYPGVCACRRQYVLKQDTSNFECLDEVQIFNDPCQIDDQCKPKFGEDAACISNMCKCSPGAHFNNFFCWKSIKLGEACGNPNNCVATDYSECDSICQCVPGYIGNSANTKCLKVAQNLGDPCEDSNQCTSVNSLASCLNIVCLCPPGHTQSGNTCTKQVAPPQAQPHSNHEYNRETGCSIHCDDSDCYVPILC